MARSATTMLDLLQACRRSKFLHFTLDNTAIRGLYLTPVGQLLSNNVYAKWNHLGSSSSTVPVFLGRSDLSLQENVAYVQKKHKATKLPFGVMVEQMGTSSSVPLGDTFTLEQPEPLELCTTYLLSASTANQFLYQLQRQRKIWWMRLSVDPGRYFISDMRRNEECSSQTTASVSICARFLDRSEDKTELVLDHLELSPMRDDDGIVTDPPNAIVRVMNNLNRTILAILMDALECKAPSETRVKIHRLIAPYKCAIVCQMEDKHCEDDGIQQELTDLSKHLAHVLHAAKLAVHNNEGSFGQLQHDRQIAQLDQIGVPYVLLLNAETLNTGLLQLRSRDTTLSETIHLSDLPSYLAKIIYA